MSLLRDYEVGQTAGIDKIIEDMTRTPYEILLEMMKVDGKQLVDEFIHKLVSCIDKGCKKAIVNEYSREVLEALYNNITELEINRLNADLRF